MGLVQGDFILKINGVTVNSYRQVAVLLNEIEANDQELLVFDVWNPHTRRTQTLTAKIED